MSTDKNRTVSFLQGMAIGGTIASAVSLLFAPKSGRRLRRDIRRESKKAYRQAEATLETAQERAEDLIDDTSERLDALRDKTEDMIEAGQDRIHNGRRKMRTTGEGLFKRSSK